MVKNNAIKCVYEDCGKVYTSQCNLNRHIKLHHLNQAFTCPMCQKPLSSKQSRDEHLYSHSKKTPYKCPFPNCEEWFRQASQLSFHKKLHKLGAIGIDNNDPGEKPSVEVKPSEGAIDIPFYYLPIPAALWNNKPVNNFKD